MSIPTWNTEYHCRMYSPQNFHLRDKNQCPETGRIDRSAFSNLPVHTVYRCRALRLSGQVGKLPCNPAPRSSEAIPLRLYSSSFGPREPFRATPAKPRAKHRHCGDARAKYAQKSAKTPPPPLKNRHVIRLPAMHHPVRCSEHSGTVQE